MSNVRMSTKSTDPVDFESAWQVVAESVWRRNALESTHRENNPGTTRERFQRELLVGLGADPTRGFTTHRANTLCPSCKSAVGYYLPELVSAGVLVAKRERFKTASLSGYNSRLWWSWREGGVEKLREMVSGGGEGSEDAVRGWAED